MSYTLPFTFENAGKFQDPITFQPLYRFRIMWKGLFMIGFCMSDEYGNLVREIVHTSGHPDDNRTHEEVEACLDRLKDQVEVFLTAKDVTKYYAQLGEDDMAYNHTTDNYRRDMTLIFCQNCRTPKAKSEFDLCADGSDPDNWCCVQCMEDLFVNYYHTQREWMVSIGKGESVADFSEKELRAEYQLSRMGAFS
jgi:hypothetical protein